MTRPAYAQIAKIRSEGGQWSAVIGYHTATAQDGTPSGFTAADKLFGDSKDAVIDSARKHYPGIEIDTVWVGNA